MLASECSDEMFLRSIVNIDDFDTSRECAGAVFACEHSNIEPASEKMLEDWLAETATGTGEGDVGDGRHDGFVTESCSIMVLVVEECSCMFMMPEMRPTSALLYLSASEMYVLCV